MEGEGIQDRSSRDLNGCRIAVACPSVDRTEGGGGSKRLGRDAPCCAALACLRCRVLKQSRGHLRNTVPTWACNLDATAALLLPLTPSSTVASSETTSKSPSPAPPLCRCAAGGVNMQDKLVSGNARQTLLTFLKVREGGGVSDTAQ